MQRYILLDDDNIKNIRNKINRINNDVGKEIDDLLVGLYLSWEDLNNKNINISNSKDILNHLIDKITKQLICANINEFIEFEEIHEIEESYPYTYNFKPGIETWTLNIVNLDKAEHKYKQL